jgi:protein-L-isoaspartate(D-aspartate) O-methyltransferase
VIGGSKDAVASDLTEHWFEGLRRDMVVRQIARRGVTTPAVLDAMRRVPRHRFVPEALRAESYNDCPLPIGSDQTISQPYIVALMTELLGVGGGCRVLEIGTGSGYQAAVLAELGCDVYSVEIVRALAEAASEALRGLGYASVHLCCRDGYMGWEIHRPFDGIVVTAAPDHVPPALVEQLKDGGRLVLPVGGEYQQLLVIEKSPTGARDWAVIPVRFVPMTGRAEDPRRGSEPDAGISI